MIHQCMSLNITTVSTTTTNQQHPAGRTSRPVEARERKWLARNVPTGRPIPSKPGSGPPLA